MPVERGQCPVGVPLGGHGPEKEDDQTFIDFRIGNSIIGRSRTRMITLD